jgi:3-dehydroquinate synthase
VDSSIGGKTGVNHPLGKNLIGAFHQPLAVFIDPTLLRTLPRREITAALAEVLKYGAIADRPFFQRLVDGLEDLKGLSDLSLVTDAIRHSCEIKARIVAEDEREGDRRRLLNFGHTIGHALEGTLGYGLLRHGEAVALGMVGAGLLSTEIAGFPRDELDVLVEAVDRLDLPALPALNEKEILAYMQRDKKVRRGIRHFVLLEAIGQPVITDVVTDGQITAALAELQRRFA